LGAPRNRWNVAGGIIRDSPDGGLGQAEIGAGGSVFKPEALPFAAGITANYQLR
jgi:hypothetical protein